MFPETLTVNRFFEEISLWNSGIYMPIVLVIVLVYQVKKNKTKLVEGWALGMREGIWLKGSDCIDH